MYLPVIHVYNSLSKIGWVNYKLNILNNGGKNNRNKDTINWPAQGETNEAKVQLVYIYNLLYTNRYLGAGVPRVSTIETIE